MRWQTATGVAIGLVLAMTLLRFVAPPTHPRESVSGDPTPDAGGALKMLVIHYVRDADFASSVQASFLPQLPADVTVAVVTPDVESFEQLKSRVGPTACRLQPIVVGHPITPWSRDRWLSLKGTSGHTLLAPRGEAAEDSWPERKGDRRSASDVASGLPGFVARRSDLYFDGGDFVCDDQTVFVTPAVLIRNLHRTVESKEHLQRSLESLMPGRRIVLLDAAPPHHAGMFMMPAGARTVVVGDPSLAKPLLSDDLARNLLPNGADFSPETQALFDAVARQVEAAGYRVVRVPTAAAPDGRTYLTYLNAILDERDGQRIVYLPQYDGVEALNSAARKVWSDLDYDVRVVDCTPAYRLGGCLRCLVNVASRNEPRTK